MKKPLYLLTPAEKAELMQELRKDAEGEKFFTGVLGNKNSFFIAKPLRRKKAASRKSAKTAA
ncbi:hypothetical protein [Prosthecobacter sp.]|uniref:hypothetical protein n=1 Tax=Prosthecobacter sp. TaxID=1965333 RepID=UPI0037847195